MSAADIGVNSGINSFVTIGVGLLIIAVIFAVAGYMINQLSSSMPSGLNIQGNFTNTANTVLNFFNIFVIVAVVALLLSVIMFAIAGRLGIRLGGT